MAYEWAADVICTAFTFAITMGKVPLRFMPGQRAWTCKASGRADYVKSALPAENRNNASPRQLTEPVT